MDRMLSETVRRAARRAAGWGYRGTARRLGELAASLRSPRGIGEAEAALVLSGWAGLERLMMEISGPYGRKMHKRIAEACHEAIRAAGFGRKRRAPRRGR